MKKLILLLCLLPFLALAEENSLTPYTVWEDRTIASTDTSKSVWFPIYDAEFFNVFIDFSDFGIDDGISFYYWLHPGPLTSPTNDSTTLGYIRTDQTEYMLMKAFTKTAYDYNEGQFYYSLHYPSETAISLARYIQFIYITTATTDTVAISKVEFLKQD